MAEINVDSGYYYDIYGGEKYDDIDRCLKRAADIVDSVITIPVTSAKQITAYKNAVCAEAEYIGGNGGAAEINLGDSVSSFSLGKFSVSAGGSSGGSSVLSEKLSDIAVMYLDGAGLLYRGLTL